MISRGISYWTGAQTTIEDRIIFQGLETLLQNTRPAQISSFICPFQSLGQKKNIAPSSDCKLDAVLIGDTRIVFCCIIVDELHLSSSIIKKVSRASAHHAIGCFTRPLQ